jgi:hypothetical protein
VKNAKTLFAHFPAPLNFIGLRHHRLRLQEQAASLARMRHGPHPSGAQLETDAHNPRGSRPWKGYPPVSSTDYHLRVMNDDAIDHAVGEEDSNMDDDTHMTVACAGLHSVEGSPLVEVVDIHRDIQHVVGHDDKYVEGAGERADRLVLPDCKAQLAKTHRQVEEMLVDLACCPCFASCSLAGQPQQLVSTRKKSCAEEM